MKKIERSKMRMVKLLLPSRLVLGTFLHFILFKDQIGKAIEGQFITEDKREEKLLSLYLILHRLLPKKKKK